ncbi:hypothetical protein LG34_11555 [Eubacterium ramulus]|uniref:Type I restriction modification DNA specificity domain-containing protein n=1 Tax=Eubacterium ramulus TaxID=39490 RepID=A0A2V1JQV7_EUBRA|nr:restriction endonuclease subunit S [Eubacterium ramulus]PWE86154.1 hypothetical protein LG34_11555 [Eubacterium ramulus]
MAEWTITTLEACTDILGDGLHGTPIYSENGEYAFVNGNNLVDGEILIKKDTKKVDESQYEKYKKSLSNRTILVSINGTLGNVGTYNSEKIILGKSACYFNVKNSVDKGFIYYVVSSPAFRQYLESNATGTTIKNISLKQMREYSFAMPSYDEQQRISSILKTIDRKIKGNKEINKNLEQQAQMLFDNFYDSLSGQSCILLSEMIDIRDGTHDSPKATEHGYPLVTSKHLLPFGVDTLSANIISKADYDKVNERSKVNTGDILISMIGTVGLISYVIDSPVEFAIKNVGLFKTSQHPSLDLYILYYLKSKSTTQHIEKCLAGSTQKYISLGELRKLPIVVPSPDELAAYNLVVRPIVSEIALLVQENRRLSNLRDTLLPKLMSGELDVSDLDL